MSEYLWSECTTVFFKCLPIEGHMGSFQFGDTLNKGTIDNFMQKFPCDDMLLFLRDKCNHSVLW